MKNRILNLTQHNVTEEQKQVGVVEIENKEELKRLLTFNELPSLDEIKKRAKAIRDLVLDDKNFQENIKFMIGGAPYFMRALEEELMKIGEPVYAFSKRVVEEKKLDNGEVEKKVVFKHEGFVEVMSDEDKKRINKLKNEFIKEIDKQAPQDEKDYMEWIKSNPYRTKAFVKWLDEKENKKVANNQTLKLK